MYIPRPLGTFLPLIRSARFLRYAQGRGGVWEGLTLRSFVHTQGRRRYYELQKG